MVAALQPRALVERLGAIALMIAAVFAESMSSIASIAGGAMGNLSYVLGNPDPERRLRRVGGGRRLSDPDLGARR